MKHSLFHHLVRSGSQGGHLTVFPISSRFSCGALQAVPSDSVVPAREQTTLEIRAIDSARISAMAVSAPLGRFLLVRQAAAVGAVRFSRFHRDYDQEPAGVLLSGGEHTHAEYDWYFQGDGSGDFTKANITYGRAGEAPRYPWSSHWAVGLEALRGAARQMRAPGGALAIPERPRVQHGCPRLTS